MNKINEGDKVYITGIKNGNIQTFEVILLEVKIGNLDYNEYCVFDCPIREGRVFARTDIINKTVNYSGNTIFFISTNDFDGIKNMKKYINSEIDKSKNELDNLKSICVKLDIQIKEWNNILNNLNEICHNIENH